MYTSPNVWKYTNFHNMEIFCGKSYHSQTVRFSENLGIFFPSSWEIDENTHNFLTRQFGEIFPVNPYNLQNMAKVNSHSHEKIWENTNIQKLRVS